MQNHARLFKSANNKKRGMIELDFLVTMIGCGGDICLSFHSKLSNISRLWYDGPGNITCALFWIWWTLVPRAQIGSVGGPALAPKTLSKWNKRTQRQWHIIIMQITTPLINLEQHGRLIMIDYSPWNFRLLTNWRASSLERARALGDWWTSHSICITLIVYGTWQLKSIPSFGQKNRIKVCCAASLCLFSLSLSVCPSLSVHITASWNWNVKSTHCL